MNQNDAKFPPIFGDSNYKTEWATAGMEPKVYCVRMQSKQPHPLVVSIRSRT